MASRHPKTTMFLNLSEELECPQFPNLPLLWRQNFLKVFLTLLFRWVLPAGLGPWGCGFPRPHTAACGSRERPRCGPRATHRGQGGRGCEDQIRPWPRTRDFGRENLLRQWDLYVRKGMKCWRFKFFRYFTILCCSLWSRLFRHLQLDSLWIDDFSLEIERHVHHNPNYSEFPERPF